jgi:YHS domain-containing protein
MELLSRFVRFVVWVLILSWVIKLLGRLAGWALRRAVDPQQRQSGAEPAADATPRPEVGPRQLVRDPVCGLHMAETLAIPYRGGGELVHFCSTECRDKYAAGILRRAANG